MTGTIRVRVVPRSAREEVAGYAEGAVRIRLTAPPVEDRANEALVRFLARALDIPRRQVELLAGLRGRSKVVRIHGMSEEEIFRRLGLEPYSPTAAPGSGRRPPGSSRR